MLKRKAFEVVCLSAARALSCTARNLQNVSEQTSGRPIGEPCVSSLADLEHRLCSFILAPSPVGCLDKAFSSNLTLPPTAGFPFCLLTSHRIPGHTGVLTPSLSRWDLLSQLRPQRMKHTRASRSTGAGSSSGGGSNGEQQPHRRRRWPRFKPSRKIMNTATLRELGELAAVEVATWNPKELAAAARRAVTLWRCEQPRAAAAVRIMQRLRLLPSPSSPPVPFRSPDRYGTDRGAVGGRGGGTGDASGSRRELETRLVADAGGERLVGDLPVPELMRKCAETAAAEKRPTGRSVHADTLSGSAVAGRKRSFLSREVDRAAARFQARSPLPTRRRVTGGIYSTSVMEKPLRPHQLQLAQLVERLVRAANGRLAEGFGSRELSSFVWSLVALGYWQTPLVPLVSAFADYGAERLRSQPNPIATAMLLQVLAKARAAAVSGQETAAKLLELAPATAVAAAAALPGCLPSCEPRTLAGLLHSCAVLLSPARLKKEFRRLSLGPSAESTVAAAEPGSGSGSGSPRPNGSGFEGHLDGRTADALAALARSATKECIRRRFYGFGAVDLLTSAGALAALQQHSDAPQLQSGSGNHRLGGGEEFEVAWGLLSSVAVSPVGPQLTGATPQQRVDLLKIARTLGGPGQLQQQQQQQQQALTSGTVSLSKLPSRSPRHASHASHASHSPASDA